MLQWEWLGGLPPLRRAAVIGAGAWGTGVATMLARAGIEVDLGTRTRGQAERLADTRRNEKYLPGVELPARVNPVRAADLELGRHDLVVFAVPAAALPQAVAAHGPSIPERAGVLVSSKGLVPPLGTRPAAYVCERVTSWAVAALAGPAHAAAALQDGASLVLAATNQAFAKQVTDAFGAAGFDCVGTDDLIGVELAGTAKNAAALAAAAAAPAGPNAAGAAAGKVFAEIDAYARSEGSQPGTFAGLAGAGDLVATVLADGSRNRRAGDMLGNGVPAEAIPPALGQAAEAIDSIPLLAACMYRAGVPAPATAGLADLIEGRLEPEQWTASLTEPKPRAA
jgi:glycerol-3-phosphate dehydrogenase